MDIIILIVGHFAKYCFIAAAPYLDQNNNHIHDNDNNNHNDFQTEFSNTIFERNSIVILRLLRYSGHLGKGRGSWLLGFLCFVNFLHRICLFLFLLVS